MTSRVVIAPAASKDVTDILRHLKAAAGERVAYRYADRFDLVFRRLAEFAQIGSPRPNLGSGIRIVLLAPYIIFYEVREPTADVFVLRVLHHRRHVAGDDL